VRLAPPKAAEAPDSAPAVNVQSANNPPLAISSFSHRAQSASFIAPFRRNAARRVISARE